MHALPPSTDYPAKAQPAVTAPALDEVLSARAKRRLAILLRFRLLELREEGLERVRAVIERRMGVEQLLQDATPLPHHGGKTAPEI